MSPEFVEKRAECISPKLTRFSFRPTVHYPSINPIRFFSMKRHIFQNLFFDNILYASITPKTLVFENIVGNSYKYLVDNSPIEEQL